MADQLARLLGRRVEGDGGIDPGIDGERRLGKAAIDRAGAGIDDVLKLGQRTAQLQDHDLAHYIGLHIGVGVDQRMADPGLGGEMDDAGDRFAFRLDRRSRGLAIGNVGAGEREGLVRL